MEGDTMMFSLKSNRRRMHKTAAGLIFSLMLFISDILYGMSEKDNMLFNMVKQSHADYLLEDYLKMTPQQRAGKEKQQIAALQKAVFTALTKTDLNSNSSLLAALLTDQDISENVFTFIINHQNRIKEKHIPFVLHWYISQIAIDNRNSNALIRNIVVNFPDPKFILTEDKLLLEEEILKNENVNIIYLLYWPELSNHAEKELTKLADKAGDENNMNKWRRNWLAACILARFKGDRFNKKTLAIASQLLRNNKRCALIYLPLGLPLTGQKESIDMLLNLLDSSLVSQRTPDAEPQQIDLAHEAAVALYLTVRNFPQHSTSEDIRMTQIAIFQDWRNKNIGKIQLIPRDLLFFLKHTQLGLF